MNALEFLGEWAIRSSILILAGALVLVALRVKDSSIRLAAWVALLFGSVALPLMTVTLPAVPVTVARAVAEPVVFFDSSPVVAPGVPEAATKPHAPFDWTRAALVVYLLIALALILRVVIGLAMSRRLLFGSRDVGQAGIRESDDVMAPVTLGIIRSVIVLPVDWRKWDEAKVTAVLAHERSHIGRFDPAMQLLSAVHRAVLWFSPASWFLHSRIVRVAEEASDDAAVTVTRDRESYAGFLLEFMRREECGAGVPMARYGAPEKRIYRILDGRSLSRGVTRWSAAAIVVLGVPLTYLAASVHSETATPRLIAQVIAPAKAPPPVPPSAPPTPVVQPAAAERPKFDIASIKPCDPDAAEIGGRGGKGGNGNARYRRNCVTVMTLIENAYIRFAGGKNRSPMLTQLTKVEGGPGWLRTDTYTIEAEAEGTFPLMMMDGPMMQSLLEDRFQLRVHRETREGPGYELTVAKGGSKIQPAKQGPCLESDFVDAQFPFGPPPPGMENVNCRFFFNTRKGPNVIKSGRSETMEDLTADLTRTVDRLVVDKTGITEKFDFRLTFAPDENTPGEAGALSADGVATAPDPAGPSIFTAVQEQLGLKLEPAKGAREYLVIDSVSRPSAN
jgi:bla regulator protein BlaR1